MPRYYTILSSSFADLSRPSSLVFLFFKLSSLRLQRLSFIHALSSYHNKTVALLAHNHQDRSSRLRHKHTHIHIHIHKHTQTRTPSTRASPTLMTMPATAGLTSSLSQLLLQGCRTNHSFHISFATITTKMLAITAAQLFDPSATPPHDRLSPPPPPSWSRLVLVFDSCLSCCCFSVLSGYELYP